MTLRNPLPEPVVRAMDAAERLLGEPIGLDDLARAAGRSRESSDGRSTGER